MDTEITTDIKSITGEGNQADTEANDMELSFCLEDAHSSLLLAKRTDIYSTAYELTAKLQSDYIDNSSMCLEQTGSLGNSPYSSDKSIYSNSGIIKALISIQHDRKQVKNYNQDEVPDTAENNTSVDYADKFLKQVRKLKYYWLGTNVYTPFAFVKLQIDASSKDNGSIRSNNRNYRGLLGTHDFSNKRTRTQGYFDNK